LDLLVDHAQLDDVGDEVLESGQSVGGGRGEHGDLALSVIHSVMDHICAHHQVKGQVLKHGRGIK